MVMCKYAKTCVLASAYIILPPNTSLILKLDDLINLPLVVASKFFRNYKNSIDCAFTVPEKRVIF